MQSELLKNYLQHACKQLDQKRAVRPWHEWWRTAAGPLAVGLSLGVADCGGITTSGDASSADGGAAGSASEQVGSVAASAADGGPAAAATGGGCPGPDCPEICDDQTDNDSDGLTDCADPDCADSPDCTGDLPPPPPSPPPPPPLYSIPF